MRAKRSHWLIVTDPPEKTRITDPRWSHGQIFVSGNKVKKQAEQWRKKVAKERANLNALRAYQATLPDLYAEPVSAPSSNPAA